ncbi:hypothetical protein [Polluticaenibacter yanchengensis]|uniref:DUF4304 domain-containing protein n=1 Tax=Polluticaenibacter yanchengensis TaxID=3014562 RepID=A0ABT4UKH2_9BACT|nr:hypothetical protein [Chitinophagaceae bacterium LY-5]
MELIKLKYTNITQLFPGLIEEIYAKYHTSGVNFKGVSKNGYPIAFNVSSFSIGKAAFDNQDLHLYVDYVIKNGFIEREVNTDKYSDGINKISTQNRKNLQLIKNSVLEDGYEYGSDEYFSECENRLSNSI